MSAETVLIDAAKAALAGVAGLNRVESGASIRATAPFAEIGPVESRDWGTKDREGREIRLTVTVRDAAEQAARLQELAEAVTAAVEGMPRELAGWRVASLAFVRGRTASEKAGLWAASLEWRARMLADA